MALVGILTTIDALKSKISNDFSRMGANTFTLRVPNSSNRQGGKQNKQYPEIDFREAQRFKELYDHPAKVSISANASFGSTVKFETEKTNPNVRVIGGDENYLEVSGFELSHGRNFSLNEAHKGADMVIIGLDVLSKLEVEPEQVMNEYISIGARRYKVIGVLASKGATMGFSNDNQVIVPVMNVKLNLAQAGTQYRVSISADDPTKLDKAVDAAIGAMRVVRGDPIGEQESFEIRKSDSTAKNLIENLSFISLAATLIGVITLLGAAIGLMNIMLVSVTERTREIGVRKSIGASKSNIRWQFLTEAIAIGQIGGLLGTLFGIIAGNIVAKLVGADFIIPWIWIFAAVVICLFVSVVSGFYPASKAANLDPIDALRYE
ncbi:MAG: FtsX-like permease family protein [Flavobacteriales bacterium]|nr:FtsX-like permease family protein [Flavobacteriales bacterium]NNK79994.1 FtsX-like permease family protein [Flavobacteriales bacterium]